MDEVHTTFQDLVFLVVLVIDNESIDECCQPAGNVVVPERWTDDDSWNQQTSFEHSNEEKGNKEKRQNK
jgi:hypothetical protein